jgi:L-2-hydroxyglutarate oxidase LhgO
MTINYFSGFITSLSNFILIKILNLQQRVFIRYNIPVIVRYIKNERADVLICGGGIIGLTIARELLIKGFENLVVIEKEKDIGKHASGKNSGVLHAGIYYSQDSLKAKFCLKGNLLMKEYCREKKIPVFETGKVIVTKNEEEIPALKELQQRALKNGTKADLIGEKELKDIEPCARTHQLALYSPLTAVVDPLLIMENLENDLVSTGKVIILKGTEYKGLKGNSEIITNAGNIRFDLFINSAGSYSDKVAHSFGTGMKYRVLPFKGTYKKLTKEKSYLVKGNIYPIPDIRNPFLGVHFTKTADGTVYIGPTAIPALGRENYGVLKGIDREALQILYRDMVLFLRNDKFRKVALSEPKKYTVTSVFQDVKEMVEGLNLEDIEQSDKIGIRPQLVDWEKKELVMDFVVLKHEKSIHILNTISPGFTSSMAFAEFVVDNYIN